MQWSVLGVMRVLMESRTKTFISPAVFSALFPLTDFVLWLDAAIMADKHISRDEFERLAVKYFFSDDISLNLTYNSNLELKVLPMSNEVQPASFCYMPRVLCRVREVKLRDNLPYNPVQTRQEIRKNFLRLSPLRVCTQIRFNSSEYSIEYGAKNSGDPVFPVSKITFVLPFATVTLATLEDFHQIEFSYKGILSVCSDFLINKLGRNGFDVPNSINDVETNQYILTVICISISILCLALTVSSYCFFPVLCNTAGLNNVSLCLTLLFAQVALVVAVHLQKYLPQGGLVCIGSGILTHFLWLCMFCWSFVCCFRVFKVFTSETRLNRMPWITRKCELGKSWAFCLIVPCVIIGAVTAVSYTITKGHSIGYSRCYLDSAMLIGLAMMMPIGLVVLGNLIFFSVTIVKIRSVLQLHPGRTNGRNEEKNLFCVYIKLSFLTGAFWTLAIVSEVLDSDPLRYMGIVTNGLQGVFIFVSYACNPRVIGLYKQKFGISNR
ncbi:uncharacterized protein LOC106014204 [Aplysia californica]|uniref:Uncharacterized protein LOC106014204 n=1 Tax=Aplysia californica TaxID=6500 RepID=A0ABM1AFX2_APLCA|nr:uncharacterized protein LOC106014204 [Aplysia californica]